MTKQSNTLLKRALELSSREKAQIIEALLASLDHPDERIDAIWADESDARIDAYEKGQISSRTAESVLAKFSRS
jgi:putative addiction module component (TIGR02574 family)